MACFSRTEDDCNQQPGVKPLERIADLLPEWVRGQQKILQQMQALEELASRTGQPEAVSDLQFHWSEPNFGSKLPQVLLFRSALRLEAAVLLYEYVLFGVPTGIFLSSDAEGERSVIAPESQREDYAWLAAQKILLNGAGSGHLLLLSLRNADFTKRAVQESAFRTRATAHRAFRRSLPLQDTLDETLAQFGPRTRRNMRALKRRAALREGIEYLSNAAITEDDFLAVVSTSAYAVSPDVARWRYRSAKSNGLLAGLRSSDGKWLALLGGRRRTAVTVVDWQTNLTNMPQHSLGLMMRAFLIEDELSRGSKELQFAGGTPHPMRNGFIEESAGFVLLGSGWMFPWLVRHLVRRIMPAQSLFNALLSWDELDWHSGTFGDNDEQ